MNAPTRIAAEPPQDPSIRDRGLAILMPGLSDDDRRQRERIASCRNIATAKVPALDKAGRGAALALCWLIIETASAWLLAPASLEEITEVAEQCRRLLIVCDTAERLEEYRDAHLG